MPDRPPTMVPLNDCRHGRRCSPMSRSCETVSILPGCGKEAQPASSKAAAPTKTEKRKGVEGFFMAASDGIHAACMRAPMLRDVQAFRSETADRKGSKRTLQRYCFHQN